MIESIALRLAEGVKRNAPGHPASVAVLKHSIAILINTISIILLTAAIGILTGHVKEATLILIAFPVLRMASGGLHLKTGTMCVVVTTALFSILSFIQLNTVVLLSLNFISLVLVVLFAPSGIEKSSRIPRKYYPLLKVISAVIVVSNFLFMSSTVAACFFVQAMSLIPLKGGETK